VKKRNGRLIINSKNWDGSENGYDLFHSTVHLPVKFMLLLLPDYWRMTAYLWLGRGTVCEFAGKCTVLTWQLGKATRNVIQCINIYTPKTSRIFRDLLNTKNKACICAMLSLRNEIHKLVA
jgi:hypothetical protein